MASIGDIVFEMTEWMRTTPLVDWALWLSTKEVCEWVQSHSFMVPALQIVHILAIAMGFGSVLMFNLRLLGVSGAGQTIPQISHRFLPWLWWSLIVLLLSGLGMVLGDPIRLLINPVFWMKIAIFIVMILVSIVHHKSIAKKAAKSASWDPAQGSNPAIRIRAAALIVLWLMIMAGGRYMAYAPL